MRAVIGRPRRRRWLASEYSNVAAASGCSFVAGSHDRDLGAACNHACHPDNRIHAAGASTKAGPRLAARVETRFRWSAYVSTRCWGGPIAVHLDLDDVPGTQEAPLDCS
jgi:hypothetical protein